MSGKKEKTKKTVQKSAKKEVPLFRTYRIPCIIIFIFSFLLFANTIGHDYAFDDSVAITGNSFTKQGVKGIPDLMTRDLFAGVYGQGLEIGGGRWRPLSLVTFAIEWEIMGGEAPAVSHFLNVLFFAGSMVLLFLVLVRIFRMPLLAFLSTLLFIAHPLHAEVVANIKSRDEIFSLLFILGTLWFLFSQKPSLLKASACYGLALLSKENGIMFILLFPLMLILFRNETLKQSLRSCLPLFVTAVLYLLVRSALVGSVGDKASADIMENHFIGMDAGQRTATVSYILFQYVRLLFFPHPLSSDYSFNQTPVVGWSDPIAIVSLLLHLALFGFALTMIRRFTREKSSVNPLLTIAAFGILYYLVHISLVSNLLFNIGAPLGERFTYLASLGFCIAVVAGLFMITKKDPASSISMKLSPSIILLALLLPLSVKTFSRNKDWENNLTLFTADAVNAPRSAKVHFYLGNSLFNGLPESSEHPEWKTMLSRSKASIYSAVRINPVFHHAWNKLGMIYQKEKNADSAIYCFEKAIAANPENLNLSDEEKRKVKSLDKTSVDALASLGSVYGELKNDLDKSIYYLSEALRYNPNNKSALMNLGVAFGMKGRPQDAISAFERALALDPNDGMIYLNIGMTYGNMGDMQKANQYFERAKALGVSVPVAK